MTTHKKMLNTWPLTRRCWIHDHSQEDVEHILHEICYYCYYYSFPCWCCIPAAATTTSASTAWLLFCLYPMACKQRLRPRGCCDGGGLNNKGKKRKKPKIYKFRDRMSNQVASLTKQRDTNPCMLHGAAVFVSTNNKNKKKKKKKKKKKNIWHLVSLVRADPAAERREYKFEMFEVLRSFFLYFVYFDLCASLILSSSSQRFHPEPPSIPWLDSDVTCEAPELYRLGSAKTPTSKCPRQSAAGIDGLAMVALLPCMSCAFVTEPTRLSTAHQRQTDGLLQLAITASGS